MERLRKKLGEDFGVVSQQETEMER